MLTNEDLAGAYRNTVRSRPARVVEVLGPAGAGKTTVVQALRQRVAVRDRLALRRWEQIGILWRICREFLPEYFFGAAPGRWFNLDELRRMVYVQAWRHALTNPHATPGVLTVLDHGPVFMLGMLQEFGPTLVRGRRFRGWSEQAISAWSEALDIVLWLDAPDETLVRRIRLRDRSHVVKTMSDCEAGVYLTRCRNSFQGLLRDLRVRRPVTILHIDTAIASPDHIADHLLQEIALLDYTQ